MLLNPRIYVNLTILDHIRYTHFFQSNCILDCAIRFECGPPKSLNIFFEIPFFKVCLLPLRLHPLGLPPLFPRDPSLLCAKDNVLQGGADGSERRTSLNGRRRRRGGGQGGRGRSAVRLSGGLRLGQVRIQGAVQYIEMIL